MHAARSKIKRQWIPITLVISSFLAMIVFYGPTDNWSWDPSFYYAQLRSPIIDNDLDYRGETKTSGIVMPYTATGLQGSPWPIGPSIFWSPFFVLAHLIVRIINPLKATGLSSPYIAMVSFGSALYGIAGIFILYRICRYYGDKFISILTILLCIGATPLFYYLFHQTIMAHATGFLVSAAFFWLYILLTEEQKYRKWSGLMFGVLIGLNFLMRWAGLAFLIFPLVYYTGQGFKALKTKDSSEIRFLALQILIAMISFGITISPQLVLWQRLYGSFLVMPQGPEAFVAGILPVNTLKVFFDTNRGLLYWCPFVLIGMIGIVRIPNREIRLGSALCIAIQVVMIGYRVDWFSGGGFGARYFVELLPIIAVGFVSLVRGWTRKPIGKAGMLVLSAGLVYHQSMLMYAVEQTANGWIDIEAYLKGRPLGLRWQIYSTQKLLRNPLLWLVPRSFINEQRQAILINLIDGVRNLRSYFVPGVAAVLTPVVLAIGFWVSKYFRILSLPVILGGVAALMAACSIYLLMVG